MNQRPQTFFLMKANPLKLFDWGSRSKISSPFAHRLRRPFRRRTCCQSRGFDLFFFPPDQPLWQKRERRGWRRGSGRRKDPYRMLSTGQWIFPTIQMYLQNAWVIHYSRFWSVTIDLRNEWCYLFADFISLILLIPLACVPLLIRK